MPVDHYRMGLGLEPGITHVHKFGNNPVIATTSDPEDIWDGGGIWLAPTAARIHNIVSTSDVDGKTGSPSSAGARTLRVVGLTSWSTAEESEDITLDGTTNVPTVKSYVIIHRMYVLTSGATSANVGTITATAVDDGTITAQIEATNGQTLMAIYGIPSGFTFFLGRLSATIGKSGGSGAAADIKLLYSPNPDTEETVFLVKSQFGLTTTGTSAFSVRFEPAAMTFVGPGILKMRCKEVTAMLDVSATFDGTLINHVALAAAGKAP